MELDKADCGDEIPTMEEKERIDEPLMDTSRPDDMESEQETEEIPSAFCEAPCRTRRGKLRVQLPENKCRIEEEADDVIVEGGDVVERGNWTGKLDFVFTCVGYAVGLGNVWRFPYLCYKNGGGAFLVPYFLMLVGVGLPLFYLELAFGQFASLGPIAVWKINPLFKGVGYACVFTSWLVSLYYNVVISQVLFYLFESFASITKRHLPWVSCTNPWNTPDCVSPLYAGQQAVEGELDEERVNNITFTTSALFLPYPTNATESGVFQSELLSNLTMSQGASMNGTGKPMTPAEEYFKYYILEMSPGIDSPGGINWKLSGCLLLVWIILLLCLIHSIRSLGKVVYFTALFPYLMLTILFFRGISLPGASKGLIYYLKPDFTKLGNAQVWSDAATQIFLSLSTCLGGLVTMSSYNKFHYNCLRDSVVVTIINCGTSMFAGLVIFSVLGFMAEEKGVEVKDVATGGPGLVFVVYPEALSRMPVPALWAIFFFIMMATLGFGSVLSIVETVLSSLTDEFPDVLRVRKANYVFRVVVFLVSFLLGLSMTTRGGIYLLYLFDYSISGIPLLVVGLLEAISIAWIYGVDRFLQDIEMMLGSSPSGYWKLSWMVVVPAILSLTIISYCISHTPLTLGDYYYPAWAQLLAWAITFLPLIIIIVYFSIMFCRQGGYELLCDVMQPLPDWGPALPEDRWGRYHNTMGGKCEDIEAAMTPASQKMFTFDNDEFNTQRIRKCPSADCILDIPPSQQNFELADALRERDNRVSERRRDMENTDQNSSGV